MFNSTDAAVLFNPSQFLANGCENCAFFGMDGDRVRVGDCTTPNFQSLLSVVDPASSWAAKWQHLSEFTPMALRFQASFTTCSPCCSL